MVLDWIVGLGLAVLTIGLVVVVALAAFTILVLVQYGGSTVRVFQTKPLFVAQQAGPDPDAKTIYFRSQDGRRLVGSYLEHTSRSRRGVVLFCHEFTANRWILEPYAGYLREAGFDLFTFDFCNHGDSEPIPDYHPLQWVTQHEVMDVEAAIEYLRSRPDAPESGIGIFGVSKGGGAALVAASRNRFVRAIVTDGAFPTLGTLTAYVGRWATIFVRQQWLIYFLPHWFFALYSRIMLSWLERCNRVRYVSVERAVARLGNRPLLAIHGQRDNYIGPEIVERMFASAGRADSLWLVEDARHNGCLEAAGDEYRDTIRRFFVERLTDAVQPSRPAPIPATRPKSQPVPVPLAVSSASEPSG